jgi:hypothetical protein
MVAITGSLPDNHRMNHLADAVFTDWTRETAARWGREPLRLAHPWHADPLFSRQSLAEFIERCPASDYSLVRPGLRDDSTERRWREGELGGLSGDEVIATIERGGMWLNMRNVHRLDPRFDALLDRAHAELAGHMPGFRASAPRMGILISSPHAQVHFHADLPGQALWQISGAKRVFIYPPRAPYLPPPVLEQIALTAVEVGIPFDPAFDKDALVFDLAPGQMLHWPLNSPHRVENHGVLNISVTTEYWTPEIRRSQMVTMANGFLRNHFGLSPTSRDISGPGFWAKAAFQAAWRRGPWTKRQRRLQRPIDFRLDRNDARGWVDIAPNYQER